MSQRRSYCSFYHRYTNETFIWWKEALRSTFRNPRMKENGKRIFWYHFSIIYMINESIDWLADWAVEVYHGVLPERVISLITPDQNIPWGKVWYLVYGAKWSASFVILGTIFMVSPAGKPLHYIGSQAYSTGKWICQKVAILFSWNRG